MLEAYRLGASLYVPVTHRDLLAIANGERWPNLRSVIFCTEDAVAPQALAAGLENLRLCLEGLRPCPGLMRFVRVRTPELIDWLLRLPGVEYLTGFVLPKFDLGNAERYLKRLNDSAHLYMPTLETRDAFEPMRMIALRDLLLERGYQARILALRIGGNDLLALLRLRRPRDRTLYRTPLGQTISQLVTIFKPYGFELTAPVFEHLDLPELLKKELQEDLAHGLCGKTAIHPSQVPLIEAAWQVASAELEVARQILCESERAVFKLSGSMCELATHRPWAEQILARSRSSMLGPELLD
ncbi:HpcH/HpaI aldolase/citrate lyase family protein [Caldichromatium japonicum]|uniref:HpcH/HpaI aldolase/citrate lyase family protein n=1 Tax=Caldichromatium japonicum TaxID=2699430 RepID=A0A6G7VFG3_9GAMM|nr:HpcH/HpaI aldolase/citrate lyase family protein [Caldichromatium japonicum]QIK38724.1 HpcH/HpaI aldolase/citrate lyase family protein [Caldichromatium japonicum]